MLSHFYPPGLSVRVYSTTAWISAGLRVVLKAGITPEPWETNRICVWMSANCFLRAGAESFGPTPPWPVVPWQRAQLLAYTAPPSTPDATVVGEDEPLLPYGLGAEAAT